MPYYGYRYYDTELGRWLSRDPIGEWGGYNLNCFVGNSPVTRWEYLGLADYDFEPDPIDSCRFVYENITMTKERNEKGLFEKTAAGFVRRKHVEVVCTCDCPVSKYEMYCKVYLWVEIVLDELYKTQDKAWGYTKEGVYGHEQRHVQNLQNAVRDELIPKLEKWEKLGESRTLERCEEWGDVVEDMAESIIDQYWQKEIDHANPHPKAKTGYPSIGTMP